MIVGSDTQPTGLQNQESIIQELLRLACETKSLDGKTLLFRINELLDARIKNEMIITKLLTVGMVHAKTGNFEGVGFQEGAGINSKSKDSLSELIKVKQLLEGLPTENIKVTSEEMEELRLIKGRVFGNG